jgi:hypothetical protein
VHVAGRVVCDVAACWPGSLAGCKRQAAAAAACCGQLQHSC